MHWRWCVLFYVSGEAIMSVLCFERNGAEGGRFSDWLVLLLCTLWSLGKWEIPTSKVSVLHHVIA